MKALAHADQICQLFMTAPGVGYIAALTFKSAVDDPSRFKRSKTVAAHFGLTPRRYQSGERDTGLVHGAEERNVSDVAGCQGKAMTPTFSGIEDKPSLTASFVIRIQFLSPFLSQPPSGAFNVTGIDAKLFRHWSCRRHLLSDCLRAQLGT